MVTATKAAVKERPILFSGAMVRAILEGRKTQTRRVVKLSDESAPYLLGERLIHPSSGEVPCPYGKPGEHLWVREGWRWYGRIREPGQVEGGFEYRADGAHRKFTDFADPENTWEQFKDAAVNGAYHWRPSIHMPRWASRITLKITGVRAERLRDITEQDAIAEGMVYRDTGLNQYRQQRPGWSATGETNWERCLSTARFAFGNGWNLLNAKRGFGWDVNPFVWVIEFRRLSPVEATTP